MTTTAAAPAIIPPMRPGRTIEGISAVLLPFTRDDTPVFQKSQLHRHAKPGEILKPRRGMRKLRRPSSQADRKAPKRLSAVACEYCISASSATAIAPVKA